MCWRGAILRLKHTPSLSSVLDRLAHLPKDVVLQVTTSGSLPSAFLRELSKNNMLESLVFTPEGETQHEEEESKTRPRPPSLPQLDNPGDESSSDGKDHQEDGESLRNGKLARISKRKVEPESIKNLNSADNEKKPKRLRSKNKLAEELFDEEEDGLEQNQQVQNSVNRQLCPNPWISHLRSPGFDSAKKRESEGETSGSLDHRLMKDIIQASKHLKKLDLGGINEFMAYADELFDGFCDQVPALQVLHFFRHSGEAQPPLASHLSPSLLSLSHLQVLTLNVEHVTAELVRGLAKENHVSMTSFNIIVSHRPKNLHPVADDIWLAFSQHSPSCEMSLNLIECPEMVLVLSAFLKPSMPLAHFRQFFCSLISPESLILLVEYYRSKLKSLHLVDQVNRSRDTFTSSTIIPDLLITMGWKCSILSEIVLVGYEYVGEDLVGLSRLRGKGLQSLILPRRSILTSSRGHFSWVLEVTPLLLLILL
ncbi:unnamed protein product [Darwinula stevensoni]|uniref:Uncharacterized protein n=1 Tax=Darwinula stevensoni TaxID=69355 RepID=A0A7R8XAJ9_9CRUS|nr:unnamed protein product [Darwinula stevensoni]CAG0891471.1 unnamed protein product [Darwinula stevensoni]